MASIIYSQNNINAVIVEGDCVCELAKKESTDSNNIFLNENKKRSRIDIFCNKNRSNQESSRKIIWLHSVCPTYQQLAQYSSFALILLFLWGILYIFLPQLASPSGQLCNLVGIILAAHIGGTIFFKITGYPALIGMILVGMILQNTGLTNIGGEFTNVTTELRKIVIVVMLSRAGFGLDFTTLKTLPFLVLRLGIIPWTAECITIMTCIHFFFDLPWNWALLTASIMSSVTPAVTMPNFNSVLNKGFILKNGLPPLALTAACLDTITSIAVNGIISSVMFADLSALDIVKQNFLSIIGGIVIGIVWGFFLKIVPEKKDSSVALIRVLLLFLGCYIAMIGANYIGYGSGGPLTIIPAAFVASFNWSKQGWKAKDNPVFNTYGLAWMLCEPTLFGLTGTFIKLDELDFGKAGIAVGCLILCVVIRILMTILVSFRCNFCMKEKMMLSLLRMAKATVQAALGPVAIEYMRKINGNEEEIEYAEILLMICIVSIIVTAPLGALLILITGPKLLTKSPKEDDVFNVTSNEAHEENGDIEKEVFCEQLQK